MDYVKPTEIARTMLAAGTAKADLSVRDILLRGALAGGLLACATSLAFTATLQTGLPLAGAIIFPAGFVMIALLNLELVTGSFALVPLAAISGQRSWGAVIGYVAWAFLANLVGCVAYGLLLYGVLTTMGSEAATGIGPKIVAAAEAKTNFYAAHGGAGLATVFVKAILGNWLVCLGGVMAMTSTSTLGKIVAAWLPIFLFFSQGFEHSVVNLFLIPTGMLLGAKVSLGGWWLWNQIPATLGNLVGGLLFTGLLLHRTYGRAPAAAAAAVDSALDSAAPSRA